MSVTAILQFPGIPDDFIRILNARFREVSGGSSADTAGSSVGLFFTHGNRPDANGTQVGTFGSETDRGVLYQVRTVSSSQVWRYTSGIMSAVFASRPTDLGVNDVGFEFRATDTYQEYRWSGTAWVEVTQANLVQVAYGSGNLTLVNGTYSGTNLPSLTLTRAGRHLLSAVFDFQINALADNNITCLGRMIVDGSAQSVLASLQGPASAVLSTRATVAIPQILYTAAATAKVISLEAEKVGGGVGGSVCNGTHTSISALWIGP